MRESRTIWWRILETVTSLSNKRATRENDTTTITPNRVRFAGFGSFTWGSVTAVWSAAPEPRPQPSRRPFPSCFPWKWQQNESFVESWRHRMQQDERTEVRQRKGKKNTDFARILWISKIYIGIEEDGDDHWWMISWHKSDSTQWRQWNDWA